MLPNPAAEKRVPTCNRHEGQNVFWGEIAPCEHVVQIYGDDQVFLDALEGFVGSGLRVGDAVVVIATAEHRRGLEKRLCQHGYNLDAARALDQYIPLDAQATLSRFMVEGWPDDRRFHAEIAKILALARAGKRRVRAFGEMVALLWAQGANGATVRLEHLWTEFIHRESFPLFCAYPRSGFTEDARSSLDEICAAHSRVFEN